MGLIKAMNKVAAYIEAKAAKSLGTPGYPKNRSRELHDSIYSRPAKVTGDNLSIAVGASKFYAIFLEDGTRYIKPAIPFLKPAITKNLVEIETHIRNTMLKELNK